MELYQLEQFKAAAELSHITKAAELLSISQPALSKNIRILEHELGYPLFDHVGKHVHLNENGRVLLKYVNEIFCSLENAKRELKELNENQEALVSFCVKAASKLIPEILQDYSNLHPKTRFSISQFDGSLKEANRYDLIISASLKPAHTPDSCTLLEEALLLALPASHPLARENDVELSALKDEPFISLQKGMGLSDIMDYYCQLAGFSPVIAFEGDSPSTLRNLIHLGLGVAFIPELTWPDMQDQKIRLLPIRGLQCRRYINLCWDSRRYLSRAVLSFKDYLIEYFSSLRKA